MIPVEFDARLTCMWCRKATPHADLATYGARCRACYDAYCATPQPSRRCTAAMPRKAAETVLPVPEVPLLARIPLPAPPRPRDAEAEYAATAGAPT